MTGNFEHCSASELFGARRKAFENKRVRVITSFVPYLAYWTPLYTRK